MVFEDNFNGNTIDTNKWNVIEGVVRDPYQTKEQQWYSPNNIEVSNGTLKLKAQRDTLLNQCFDIWIGSNMETICNDFYFTSAEIDSKIKFYHGKFEIRCKLPKGVGFWPAAWTYGGSKWNEIDIFEFWNEYSGGKIDENKLSKVHHMNHHYDFDNNGNNYMCPSNYTGPDFSSGFHTFTLIWEKDRLEWYVDGELKRYSPLYFTINGQAVYCNSLHAFQPYILNKAFPREPMNFIVNLAIQSGNNEPNNRTHFPSYLEVDYIRFYTKKPENYLSTENNVLSNINIYPNPANSKIKINCDNFGTEQFNIKIINLLGEVLISNLTNHSNIQVIDLSSLDSGIYQVVIFDSTENKIYSEKIIKK